MDAKISTSLSLLLIPRISRTRAPEESDTKMKDLLRSMWSDDSGQDVAEYAVMLAVILVIVVGTIKLIGGQSNNVFSEVASSIQ